VKRVRAKNADIPAWRYRKVCGWPGRVQASVSSRGFSILSLGGAFIPTPEPPPVGTSIKLVFEMSGKDIRARAVVRRRVSGSGMGVEFVAMGYEERGILLRLLKGLAH
jgi:hypothetical protein